jgi:hypothetical protein
LAENPPKPKIRRNQTAPLPEAKICQILLAVIVSEMSTHKITHNGFEYHRNKLLGGKEYHRCAKFASHACKAKLVKNGDAATMKGEHVSRSFIEATLVNTEAFVEEYVHEAALDRRKYPNEIFESLLTELNTRYGDNVIQIPSKKQISSMVREIRGESGERISDLESPPLCNTIDGKILLRRNWFGDIHGAYHRILLWASDEGLAYLRYEGQVLSMALFELSHLHLLSA